MGSLSQLEPSGSPTGNSDVGVGVGCATIIEQALRQAVACSASFALASASSRVDDRLHSHYCLRSQLIAVRLTDDSSLSAAFIASLLANRGTLLCHGSSLTMHVQSFGTKGQECTGHLIMTLSKIASKFTIRTTNTIPINPTMRYALNGISIA